MSNFPYAFPKLYVLNGTVATTGDSSNLAAGDFGLFDKVTNVVVTTGNVASHPYVYAAQGSYYAVDKVGTLGGTPLVGLKESLKTPGINAKYVTKFYKRLSQTPANHIVQVGTTTTALNFEANQTYNLRVEAKGSPALRMLNRHMYKHIPYFTGCSTTDCLTGCDKEYVDPASVMLGWADYINLDPLLSLLVQAQAFLEGPNTTGTFTSGSTAVTVASGTNIAIGQLVQGLGIAPNTFVSAVTGTSVTLSKNSTAAETGTALIFSTPLTDSYTPQANSTTAFTTSAFLIIQAAYVDTVFSDCSFNPNDFYQKEPIIIYVSLVDKDGDACATGPHINSNVGQNTVEIQAPVAPEGLGESVIRDYMLAREYEGIHFNWTPRKREVEQDPIFSVVSRSAFYTRYYVQFHVPVFSNPSNTFSSNQYLVGFAFLSSTDASTFETLISGWLAANNPLVSLQTIA